MSTSRLTTTTLILASLAAPAWGQGFLVVQDPGMPRPTSPGFITTAHHVDAQIENQVARVQVAQTFRNPGGRPIEVEYFFPLPEDGAIDNFVLTVDGKEMAGKILPRDEARRIYESIVRRRKDPALLEYMGRGLFKTSVFPVAAGSDSQISLSYTQVLRRDGNLATFAYPLGGAKPSSVPVQDLRITGRIQHGGAIKSVYSPTHSVDVTRGSDTTATFRYQQAQAQPRGEFRLMYGVAEGDVGLSMISYRPDPAAPGHFLLLASPKIAFDSGAVLPKSVILVLDKSGSMTGQKIEQAKNSLRFVLRNLNANDTFNVITYGAHVTPFQKELQRCDTDSVAAALQFVDRIQAGGSTNIDGALRSAMEMVTVEGRPSYIVFLTDGLPTAGEQRVPAIVQNCRQANRVRARLMAFGVGNDVNAQLLDKLVAENFGASHYVRPNEDIEGPISKLYSRLSSPVLSDVALDFAGLDRALTYPQVLPDVFRGGQLVIVGRYHQSGPLSITLRGRAGDNVQSFTLNAVLDDRQAPYANAFVEKLWAERRIGYLIDEIDLQGPNKELTEEIVRLSTRHGILTPYTSFLADDRVDLAAFEANAARAGDNLLSLQSTVSGPSGVAQRETKGKLKFRQSAPTPGMAVATDIEGYTHTVDTVYQLGRKTFYRRGGRWMDSTVTPEREKAARRIRRFSDEYFQIASRLPANDNQYLALDGEIVIEIGGETIIIEPEE